MSVQFSSLIPPYPINELSDTSTSRFSGADWFRVVRNVNATVAGIGGIGSWLAFMLARTNLGSLCLIDPDKVDRTNMAGQFYHSGHIGQYKVVAMAELIKQFAGYYHISTYTEMLTEYTDINKVVFCGFDNMEARKNAYLCWKNIVDNGGSTTRKRSLFVDGRLSAEVLQVFAIPGDVPAYMEMYEKDWLFSDEEAESVICSYKQTSYCANMIASIMTNVFVNWCANQASPAPIVERTIPFMYEYEGEQMFSKVIV